MLASKTIGAQQYDHASWDKFQDKFQKPERFFSIIASKEGYYPNKIILFKGEKATFFVTSIVKDPSCLIVEGADLFLPANLGKMSEGSMTFEQAGEFQFYCPSSANRGTILVLGERERAAPLIKINRRDGRDLASEDTSSNTLIQSTVPKNTWRPKEY